MPASKKVKRSSRALMASVGARKRRGSQAPVDFDIHRLDGEPDRVTNRAARRMFRAMGRKS